VGCVMRRIGRPMQHTVQPYRLYLHLTVGLTFLLNLVCVVAQTSVCDENLYTSEGRARSLGAPRTAQRSVPTRI
jgi:hypothetical protein